MSPIEFNEAVKRSTNHSILHLVVLVVLGIAASFLGGQVLNSFYAAPVYTRNSTSLVTFGNYLGINVVRTRNGWCSIHPSRILYTYRDINGVPIPVIDPTYTNNFLWPVQGKQRFVVMVGLPADLPDGQWYVQSSFTDSCHWWNYFLGPEVLRTQPIGFKIVNHKLDRTGIPDISGS